MWELKYWHETSYTNSILSIPQVSEFGIFGHYGQKTCMKRKEVRDQEYIEILQEWDAKDMRMQTVQERQCGRCRLSQVKISAVLFDQQQAHESQSTIEEFPLKLKLKEGLLIHMAFYKSTLFLNIMCSNVLSMWCYITTYFIVPFSFHCSLH